MAKILVIDDEQMIRLAFAEFLADDGHTPFLAEDAASGLRMAQEVSPDMIFLDYRLPDRDGLSVLAEISVMVPGVAVVFMTAFGAMDVVIKAMQAGAYEYLTKPLALEQVRGLIAEVVASRCHHRDSEGESAPTALAPPGQMVGSSPAMQEIYKKIGILTVREVTVLITGESGVGKELVARAIHQNSPRRELPFVAVNCGALPEALLESELFGHERGAFTGADARKMGKFEAAGNGTIFLDEIGELPTPMQVKLLRVLQGESFYRVGGNEPIMAQARVLAATNRDLVCEIAEGRFRQDLYYRLNLVHIHIPPLRERPDDIRELVAHFMAKVNRELGRQVRGVSPAAMERIMSYAWPGNVRELENQLKQAVILAREDMLEESAFSFQSVYSAALPDGDSKMALRDAVRAFFAAMSRDGVSRGDVMPQTVSLVEEVLLREALALHEGNQVKAAQHLGLHRTTLRSKIKEYGI